MSSFTSQIKSLKSSSLPHRSQIVKLQNQKEQELLLLLSDPSTTKNGIELTPAKLLTLQGLLLKLQHNQVAPSVAKTEARSRSIHSGLPSLAHFDIHTNLTRVKSDISDGIADGEVNNVLSIFHNESTLRQHTAFTPQKRWQSAVQKIIKRNQAAKLLQINGSNKSFCLKDTVEFQSNYESLKTTNLVFKLCNVADEKIGDSIRAELANVDHWSTFKLFNIFEVLNQNRSQTVTVVAMTIMAASHRLLQSLRIKPMVLMRYIDLVCETYQDDTDGITYHTALHGVDVMQGLHSLLSHRSSSGKMKKKTKKSVERDLSVLE